MVASILPVFLAAPSRLTSDESLYSAEALNIATGKGPTYTTGDPITHRPPLYPALLAAPLKLAGASLDEAYWVPRLAIVANAVLVLLLARSLFGDLAGGLAGVLAAASPYLNGLGTTLFLDSTETAFILASLYAYWVGYRKGSVALHALAGALLGAAFLVKESAVLFLPLPFVFPLVAGRYAGWRAGAFAWSAAFLAATGWWWVWVYAQEGWLYMLGFPQDWSVQRQVAVLIAGLAAVGLLLWRLGGSSETNGRAEKACPEPVEGLLGLALMSAWGGLFVFGLEQTGWAYSKDYAANVPAYLRDVFVPAAAPGAVIGLTWLWAAVRCARGDRAAALPVVALGLFAAFFLFVANRGLSLRDGLPAVYLSHVVTGGAAAWLLAWGDALARERGAALMRLAGYAVVAAIAAAVVIQGAGRLSRTPARAPQDDWNNGVALATASWLDANVAPGTPVMSSRLYYSQVYFLTGGRFPIAQLPTVMVEVDPAREQPLRRLGTLFRWEPTRLPADSAADRWLYLTRYPQKGYYIALAENDLLAELRSRRTGYVVLNTVDAGFSSPSVIPYFDANPAFTLVCERQVTPRDATRIYAVNLNALDRQPVPARVTRSAFEGLLSRLRGDAVALQSALDRLNPAGAVLSPE